MKATHVLLIVLMTVGLTSCGGSQAQQQARPQQPAPQGPPVAVTVSPISAEMDQGATQQFTATITGTTNTAVTWSVQEAVGGSITAAGLYAAPALAGTFHVAATSQADPSKSAAVNVVVRAVSISVDPTSATLDQGASQQFIATVTGTINAAVTWSVQETGGGSITNAGLYTAPGAAGTFHAVATSVADSSKAASAIVTVVAPTVVVQPSSLVLARGGGFRFVAFTNEWQLNPQVTWSVVEPDGGTITNDGGYGTYKAPNQLGTFHVTATSTVDPQVLGTGTISVVGPGFVAIPGNIDENDTLSDLTTTLLPDGRALIVGGLIDCVEVATLDCTAFPFTILRSSRIYDSSTRTFSFAGSLVTGRYGHTATLLDNGKVLVVGGFDSYCVCSFPVATAEIFDPATSSFSPAGNPQVPRAYHTATLLADGTVLIAGGVQGVPDFLADGSVPALRSAEIYNPATDSFSSVGNMSNPRLAHTATLLTNGMALIVGGAPVSIGLLGANGDATAELYDSAAHAFSPAAPMTKARFGHTATLLPTGNVLVAGGSLSGPTAPVFAGGDPDDSVEIFDFPTNSWSAAAAMTSPRAFHTATLLPSGHVLFPGTLGGELYNPQSGISTPVGALVYGRWRHTATLMPDGSVLVVSGSTGIIELYLEDVPPSSSN